MDILDQLHGAHWTDASERLRLVNLAADEIERLREALQWAIKDCDAKTNHESIKRELLEALEGK
jgi:hypothetical protein